MVRIFQADYIPLLIVLLCLFPLATRPRFASTACFKGERLRGLKGLEEETATGINTPPNNPRLKLRTITVQIGHRLLYSRFPALQPTGTPIGIPSPSQHRSLEGKGTIPPGADYRHHSGRNGTVCPCARLLQARLGTACAGADPNRTRCSLNRLGTLAHHRLPQYHDAD